MVITNILNKCNLVGIGKYILMVLVLLVIICVSVSSTKGVEGFSNNSNTGLINNIISSDNNYYLNQNKYSGIVARDYLNLPTLKCSSNFDNIGIDNKPNTYHDKILKYFKKHIFPIEPIVANSDDDVIGGMLNNNIDIGIVNEEYLRNYLDKNIDKDRSKNINEIINFSMIGGLYYLDMYLIGQPDSELTRLSELKSKITIYTLPKYKIYLKKLVQSYQFTIKDSVNIVEIENIDELIKQYMNDDIEYIFLLSHPLDKYLLEMSDTKRIKLIHLQDREEDAIKERESIELNTEMTAEEFYRFVRSNRLNSQEVINRNNIVPSDDIDRDTHKNILKRYMPRIYSKVIDLNYFHSTSNEYTYLETYSIKYILVANNNINPKHIKILTTNLIKHMGKMRNHIIMNNYIVGYQNHNNYDLKVDELLVVDHTIPLHQETKSVYERVGLIKFMESDACEIKV